MAQPQVTGQTGVMQGKQIPADGGVKDETPVSELKSPKQSNGRESQRGIQGHSKRTISQRH